jgi:AraC family transcriptional regulator
MPAEESGKTSPRVPMTFGSARFSDRFTQVEETGHSEYAVAVGSETITKIVRAHSFNAPEHSHSDAQLSFFRKGASGTFLTHSVVGRSRSMSVAPGSVTFIPHNQPHRVHWQGDGELLHMYFSIEFMARATESGYSARLLRSLSHQQESTINAIGQCLSDEFYWSGQLHPEFVDHARFLIATRLLHVMDADASKSSTGLLGVKRLKPAVEFLNEHSETQTSLTDLAALCGVSIYHFARSFSAQLGCAPFAYQRALRLEKARELLRESDLAIEAVGIAVGIESASNFARLFRRTVGLSPSEYRRLHSGAARAIARKQCETRKFIPHMS